MKHKFTTEGSKQIAGRITTPENFEVLQKELIGMVSWGAYSTISRGGKTRTLAIVRFFLDGEYHLMSRYVDSGCTVGEPATIIGDYCKDSEVLWIYNLEQLTLEELIESLLTPEQRSKANLVANFNGDSNLPAIKAVINMACAIVPINDSKKQSLFRIARGFNEGQNKGVESDCRHALRLSEKIRLLDNRKADCYLAGGVASKLHQLAQISAIEKRVTLLMEVAQCPAS